MSAVLTAPATRPLRLNLGSGNRRGRHGYTTLDMNPAHEPDIVATVPPIPLPDASCASVYASHLIEHLSDADACDLMREVYRVLTPGGQATFKVPYALTHSAIQDPTHRSLWVPEKFLYFTGEYAYLDYGLETRFVPEKLTLLGDEITAVMRKPGVTT